MTETVNLKAYWERVSRFSQYPEDRRAHGYALGLLAEAGEVCGVVDKWLRGKYDGATMTRKLLDELGDVCWYAAAWLDDCDCLDDDKKIKYYWHELDYVSLVYRIQQCMSKGVNGPDAAWIWDGLDIIACVCLALDTTLQAVLDANVAKLEARHDPAR